MHCRLLLYLGLVALVGSAGRVTQAADKGGTEQTLQQLEKDWAQAFVKFDAASVERIEASDFVSTAPDGKVGDKAQDLKDLKTGNFKAESMDVDDMKVHVYGTTAVVTGRTTIKNGKYGGQDISGQYRFTDTWVKNNGKWQVVASQGTMIKQ